MKRIVCIAIATIAICLTSTSYAQSDTDCTAPTVQALAPEGIVVAPIADANSRSWATPNRRARRTGRQRLPGLLSSHGHGDNQS